MLLHEDAEWRDLLDIVAIATTRLVALPRVRAAEDGKAMPPSSQAAFHPDDSVRWRDIEAAWRAIGPMCWGPRLPPTDATAVLRAFLGGIAGS